MMRRLGAAVALAALVVLPPWLLLVLGFREWHLLSLQAATDLRLLLALLTVVGWSVWLAWTFALAVELVGLTTGRLRLALPGLGWPRALAGTLLTAALATQIAPVASAVAAPTARQPDPGPATVAAAAPDDADAATPAVPDAAPTAALATAPGRRLVHHVELGDDLWSLAERYYGAGDQWRWIVAANPHLAADPLADPAPGTTLTIVEPVTLVTVRAGDSLSRIAATHLGDARRWPEIFELNRDRIADPDVIDIGWLLRVPLVVAGTTATAAASEDVPPPQPEPDPVVTPTPDAAAAGAGDAPASAARPDTVVSEAPAEEGADNAPPDRGADDPRAVVSLVGGLTSLTAAAVLGGIAWRRHLQELARPVGRRYVQPDGELARFEAALGMVRTEGESDRDTLLARALRHLSRHWHALEVAAPDLSEAVLCDHAVEFRFAHEPADPPPGFQRIGVRYTTTWHRLRQLDDVDHPVAYPALVTLGEDASGNLVMVDVLASGLLGVRDRDGTRASETLSALLVELACAPWTDELRLLVVTRDAAFASIAGVHRVRTTPDADAALAEVERIVRARRGALDGADPAALRLDPDRSDAWAAHVVVFEDAPSPAQVARLAAAIEPVRCGVAAVLPVGTDAGEATWELTGDRTLIPQAIPTATREAIGGLYALAETTNTVTAPWWSDEEPEDPVNIIELRPRVPDTGAPRVLLLGPVALVGAAGDEPARAQRQCVEYCAWLLEHPASTATQMTADLFVTDGTRRSNLSRLRSWLGAAPDGSPYLPEAYSGRMTLHPDVTSDWHDLRTLTAGGLNRMSLERIRTALGLVRGAPLADAAPGAWGWAESLRSDMVALIRDLGVVGSRLARERRDLDAARWCASRALSAAPDDELLLGERIRTERAAGRMEDVERLVGRLHRQARILGVDLLPESVDLVQECVEGRLRAREA